MTVLRTFSSVTYFNREEPAAEGKKKGWRSGICLLCLMVAGGCAHISMDGKYEGPRDLPEELAGEFVHRAFSGDCSERVIERAAEYTVKEIALIPCAVTAHSGNPESGGSHTGKPRKGASHAGDPQSGASHAENHQKGASLAGSPSRDASSGCNAVVSTYYQIHEKNRAPVIILLPALAGKNIFVGFFARYFASRGFAAVIVQRQKRLESFAGVDKGLREAVFAQRTVMDWVSTRPELDPGRIGLFGISMGGIEGVLLSAVDRRIKASVIALAAGDLPRILAHTDEKRIRRAREKLMAEEKLTVQELYLGLKEKIRLDPDRFAPYCDARSILMILAVFDRTILFAGGKALRRKMGNPETIYLLAGHRTALLYIPYVKRASMNFFRRKLGASLPPSRGPL